MTDKFIMPQIMESNMVFHELVWEHMGKVIREAELDVYVVESKNFQVLLDERDNLQSIASGLAEDINQQALKMASIEKERDDLLLELDKMKPFVNPPLSVGDKILVTSVHEQNSRFFFVGDVAVVNKVYNDGAYHCDFKQNELYVIDGQWLISNGCETWVKI